MRKRVSLRTNRRGLSPIFASLILLGVVTVLFIPVFIWVSGLTSTTSDSWQSSGTTATERIVIEELNLKIGQTNCTIYIRNIGQTAVAIDNVFISLANGTGTVHAYSGSQVITNTNSVIPGDLLTITIPLGSFTPQEDVAYLVKVYTTRGVGDSYQVVAKNA